MTNLLRVIGLTAAVGLLVAAGCGQKATKTGAEATPSTTAAPSTSASAPGKAPSAGGVVSLQGAGATFPYPIYAKWFYEYNKANPKVQVNYQAIGSGGGIKAIRSRTVDFGASDAPLTKEEFASMPAPLMEIPTVGGAVALGYNLPIKGQLRLTATTLAGIYLGEITKWNDPKLKADNPGVDLPDEAITVVHRSDGSGTTYLFTSYLSAVSSTWKQQVGAAKDVKWPVGQGGKGNPGVAGVVKQVEGAIGYVEAAYSSQNKIPVALLKNRSGAWVAPTIEGATAAINGAVPKLKKDLGTPTVDAEGAKAYPIAGVTFLLVYKHISDPAKGKALVNLLKWCMGPGQEDAESLEYARLPEALLKINQGLIDGIKVGS